MRKVIDLCLDMPMGAEALTNMLGAMCLDPLYRGYKKTYGAGVAAQVGLTVEEIDAIYESEGRDGFLRIIREAAEKHAVKGRLFSGQFYYSAGNSPGCTDCNGAHDNIVWPNCSDLDNYRTRNNGTVGKSFSGYGGKDLLSASLWLCNGRNNAGGTVAGRGGKRPCPALRTLV